MIKIAICGAAGRMGQAILAQALRDKDLTVTGLVEAPSSPLVGKTLQNIPVRGDVRHVLEKADVVIDFTAVEATLKNAPLVAKARRALVVGTTGVTGSVRDRLLKSVRAVPVVLSPNMSLSANLMFDVAERLSRKLTDYDVEITEVHHNQKKDAPSGTAMRLAESVKAGRSGARFVFGRQGLVGARKSDEVGVHALRGGDVVGDHTVFFFGRGERIELVHRVTSREAFAAGAVVAAKWVKGRRPGAYDMRDVLGLKDRG
jgi:4-hydroxy-tetrahydrodipicolinate reductase